MPGIRAKTLLTGLGALALAACGGGGGGGGNSTPPPPPPPPPPSSDIALTQVFDQLTFAAPVALLQAPGDDSRWYVAELDGEIFMFDNQPGVAVSTQFADLRARVDSSEDEAGLLGMAFHPDFANNGEVFLSFTETSAPLIDSIVAKYVVDGAGLLDPGSEEILLRLPQTRSNHNGGHLAFGPDGFLYVGFGDGGGAGDPDGNGQNTRNLHGTIIRIDVDGNAPYEVPADNPFAPNTECAQGSGTSNCPEIFAWGFRNPWRFSFDRQTGDLWAGDVGQNDWEEVDRVELGLNYGWSVREGAHCFNPPSGCGTNFEDPVTEYETGGPGSSVTGGYVYRGAAIPGLVGDYVFGDFVSGVIFSVPATSALGTAPEQRLDTSLNIVSFAEDSAGELYVLDFGGTIHQVIEEP